MVDPEKMAKHIDSASVVLSMGVALAVRRSVFKSLKPTDRKIGWSFGFCDGFAQSRGMQDDEDFILFISMVFERVFGRSGLAHFRKVAMAQERFSAAIFEGGNAHLKWIVDGTPPLMPLPG